MPTTDEAFAAVAAYVADVDPHDADAVDVFYLERYPHYPAAAQQLMSEFLVASVEMPQEVDLIQLASRVNEIVGSARRYHY